MCTNEENNIINNKENENGVCTIYDKQLSREKQEQKALQLRYRLSLTMSNTVHGATKVKAKLNLQ